MSEIKSNDKLYLPNKQNSSEIENLKREINLVELVKSDGCKLKKQGNDYVGCCPFHKDDNASLRITPSKNLWHCFGCAKGGSVIDWVMTKNNIDCRKAIEILRNRFPNIATRPTTKSTPVKSSKPVINLIDKSSQQLLKKVVSFYNKQLKDTPVAQKFLEKRGLKHPEIIDHFQLGFASRTLSKNLPKGSKEIKEQLTEIGIYRQSGHEHLSGSLVVPVINKKGEITEIYGRKINNNLRQGTPYHLYLPGKHSGIFNPQSLDNKEIILCESIIDALSFWVHGFHNVTASYGVQGFNDEYLQSFIENKIEKVYIAYDNDNSGITAAKKLADKLQTNGIECLRVMFPNAKDANEFICNSKEPAKDLQQLLNNAFAIGEKPVVAKKETAKEEKTNSILSCDIPIKRKGEDIEITFSSRVYRIRGLSKNLLFNTLRVNIRASMRENYHIDTLDLFQARHRSNFIRATADELGMNVDVIKRDIGKIILKLEELQEENINNALSSEKPKYEMTAKEEKAALGYLSSPQLIENISADFEKCGLIGEKLNALATYVSAASRKLDNPLAIIIQSSSSAGKSSLMDMILAMTPDEEQVKYTSMTGQSLFYLGENDLVHKTLAISEEEGAERASYSLKMMQSEKRLCIASTGKDPKTGRLVTNEYTVKGPTQIILTTTAIEIDEELQNRCLIVTIDEARSQTKAIHDFQRLQQTVEGLMLQQKREELLQLHKNVQRLIKPIMVVNPFATKLTFLDTSLRTRRDHVKYLTLIRAIALLHQYQRPKKTVEHEEKTIEYIEVTVDDVRLANLLAHHILGTSLDELAPQTRKLLNLMWEMVKDISEQEGIEPNEVRFTQRQVRAYTHWGYTQTKVHISRLLEMEYLVLHRASKGQSYIYELVYKGEGLDGTTFLTGLIDVDKLTTM